MTATETIRRLLDERGEKWADCDIPSTKETTWGLPDIMARFEDDYEGRTKLTVYDITPAQAIEATLGREECHADETDVIKCWVKAEAIGSERMELIHVMECSECGGTYEHVNGGYEFCPRCGRKVVGE